MKKTKTYLFVITFLILSGLLFFNNAFFTQANNTYNGDLILERLTPLWANVTGGETKTANLKIINNTGYGNLKGKAFLDIEYKGDCSNNIKKNFEGGVNAIAPQFRLENTSWLEPDSDWNNGEITFSHFVIPSGNTLSYLKITTHPALCPGEYFVTFIIQGTTETKTYTAAAVITGGIISPTTSVTSTTIPGKILGENTKRPFWKTFFPFIKGANSEPTTTVTTITPTQFYPNKNQSFNPFLASMLNIGAHIPIWLLILIAIISFGGAWYLYRRNRY